MPIPAFDHNGVIPPYDGVPTSADKMAPYPATMLELCQRFGTSAERRSILRGLLQLREALRQVGVVDGFQWIDGSFLEDIEHAIHRPARPPKDVDVVSFYRVGPTGLLTAHPLFSVLTDPALTMRQFSVDHQAVNLAARPETLVDATRFWFGLFSHQRVTEVWKGMLAVKLLDLPDDTAAIQYLATLPQP